MMHIISLGAGVQSSTMALMAAAGEITPMPDAAIFADTHAEPKAVYEWLDWLEKELPFPVHRVAKDQGIEHHMMQWRLRKGYPTIDIPIPMYVHNPDGRNGPAGRDCTRDFKVKPLERKVKELLGLSKSDRWPTELSVVQWLGISLDEMQRMKTSVTKWQEFRHPLIELRMARWHCLEWMKKNGYPEPPRSACYFCPFHSNQEWKDLTDDEMHRAVNFERVAQEMMSLNPTLKGTPYLHRDCVPLNEADLRSAEDHGQLSFLDECAGMCGV